MAENENEDTPMISSSDSSDSESGSSSEGEAVEWLVNNREKRSTAGQRLTTLINEEAEDDELQLLFVEDEDDAGFKGGSDDGSDAQMSSSDDDDEGPGAGAEDLEGEKELQQEEKKIAKRAALKRKADFGVSAAFKKRVKIDPTVPGKTSPPHPKKKIERSSRIRGVDGAPIRASNRGTTKQSKELLREQLVGREIKKLRAEANREANRKVVMKAKVLTQEDRLAEAARVEKKNARSLNRWEEAEKTREEEQRAKLAALHNRKMEGPFITWWSGMVEFVDGKLRRVGKNITIEEKKERKKKTDQLEADVEDLKSESMETPAAQEPVTVTLDGTPPPIPLPSEDSAPLPAHANSPPQPQQPLPIEPLRLVPSPDVPFTFAPIQPPTVATFEQNPSTSQKLLQATTAPPVIEHSTRNSLILSNFNETAVKSKDTQLQILFGRKFPKQGKIPHPPLCAITHSPAKFIDPASGLPYRNAYAYKEIQKLRHGEYPWSSLIQAYVGQGGGFAARGVPGRFTQRNGEKAKGKGKE